MDISYRIHGEDIAGLSLQGGGEGGGGGRERAGNLERNLYIAEKVDGIKRPESLAARRFTEVGDMKLCLKFLIAYEEAL
jgi:hypothetical protein